MTKDEVATIIRVIKATYPTYKPDNLAETINVWFMMLEDQDTKLITMALKTYIRTNNTGFAPSIGQLLDYAHKISTPEAMTASEAWGLVMKAVRRSAYNSLEEFSKLPETIQQAVGTPEYLQSMAIDTNFNEMVASSNFQKAYNIVLAREKERQQISKDVLKLIETVNIGSPKQLVEQNRADRIAQMKSIKVVEMKEDAVPMPDDVREKLEQILGG